jgi:hypothetical protein
MRHGDTPEDHRPAGAEGGGGVLVAGVGGTEPGLHREHKERHGDEGVGRDHAPHGERQQEPGRVVDGTAEQAAPPEGEEQRRAAHHRRQDHRQQNQRPRHRAPREPGAREHPRQRDPEQERDPGGRERGGDAEPQRVDDDRPTDQAAELRPRRPLQQRHERNGDVGHGDAREGEDQPRRALMPRPRCARAPAVHGASKP